MTKPSSSLPVLYARVPVETYALAQLLAGEGKTSLSKWIVDLIESQRGTLGGQPLPPYAQPVKREFTFAFGRQASLETRKDAVRFADYFLRLPHIRDKRDVMMLQWASDCILADNQDPEALHRTFRALGLLRKLMVLCPNGVKAQVFEVTMSDELSPVSRVQICIGRIAGEIWDDNHHAWWEMVRTLSRLAAPEYWDDLRAHEAKTQRAIAVASANERAELEPGIAAVAPVKRGRGRPRKPTTIDREDGHQRAAEAACSGDDQ